MIFVIYLFRFKLLKNKLVASKKTVEHPKINNNSELSYKKIFYLILLIFVLTQSVSRNNFTNLIIFSDSSIYDSNTYHDFFILEDVLSLFTLFTFYLFIYSFFISKDWKEKKDNWKLISLIILFLNLLFNLFFLPEQLFFLLNSKLINISEVTNCFIFCLIYILVLRFLFTFFKKSFNYCIKDFLKLTIVVYNYETLKDIFIKNKKINIATFLSQLWEIYWLVAENEAYNYLIEDNCLILTLSDDFATSDRKLKKRNLRISMLNKNTLQLTKILKDYIFLNGWKMSLIQ